MSVKNNMFKSDLDLLKGTIKSIKKNVVFSKLSANAKKIRSSFFFKQKKKKIKKYIITSDSVDKYLSNFSNKNTRTMSIVSL